ncbi:MAG TPA: HPr kinase/phosphorylase [Caulobacteraceae bacterium]|nr:HPr kinase/phosphorylase [Caulobacteraceae bacterium]
MILHAGLIAIQVAGDWRGALIQGPSGIGKSDLALRALDCGFRLVADDRVVVFVSAGRLFGRAPQTLHGLIEARGLGVVGQTALRLAPIALSVRCKPTPEAVERLPEPSSESLLGCDVPVFEVWPLEYTAPAKIRRAIEHLGARP